MHWKQLIELVINDKKQSGFLTDKWENPMSKKATKKEKHKGMTIIFQHTDREPVYLTQRESECLNHILHGLTLKETSQLISLSTRTVEFYFSNIKKKIGCKRKSEVISLFLSSDFLSKIGDE